MNRLLPVVLISLISLSSFGEQPGSLTIGGDIPGAVTLAVSDLAAMPRLTVKLKEHNGETASYEGVLVFDLLQKAGLVTNGHLRGKALAAYVVAVAHDGYQVVFSAGELDPGIGTNQIIVADKRNGQPITGDQGPLRLVSSTDKVEARSVRMLEKIQFVKVSK